MLLRKLTGWRSQYDLMNRTYSRLGQSYVSSIDYDDDLRHFFQDCWHLKDWIKNDAALKLEKTIEKEVNANKSLRIVADLALGSKHFVRRAKSDREGANVTGIDVTVHLGQARGVDVVHRVTLNDGSTVTAREVASDALKAWDTVLRKCGLV